MVTTSLGTIRRRWLYQAVLERMTEMVQSGEVGVGQPFPSERELAGRYGVSATVVREAFRVLEHAGLVTAKQGTRRCLIGSSVVFGSRLVSMEKELTYDLLEARRIFEIPIVRLAAHRRDQQDVAKLTQMRLSRPVVFEGHEEMRADDMNLHLALAAATHNRVLYSIQEHINRIRAVRLSIAVSVETRLQFRKFQIPMVQAVINQDPEGAAAALRAHYDIYEEILAVAPEFRTGAVLAANGQGGTV